MDQSVGRPPAAGRGSCATGTRSRGELLTLYLAAARRVGARSAGERRAGPQELAALGRGARAARRWSRRPWRPARAALADARRRRSPTRADGCWPAGSPARSSTRSSATWPAPRLRRRWRRSDAAARRAPATRRRAASGAARAAAGRRSSASAPTAGDALVQRAPAACCAPAARTSWSFSGSTCPSCGETDGRAAHRVRRAARTAPVVGRARRATATRDRSRTCASTACATCQRYLIDVDLGRDAAGRARGRRAGGAAARPLRGRARPDQDHTQPDGVLAMAEITPGKAYGFFTDTSVCIGCKACEVACKEWNQLPGQRAGLRRRLRQHRRARRAELAARPVHRQRAGPDR